MVLLLGHVSARVVRTDFAASNQWLKRFKTRFPGLEVRYSNQLRNQRTMKVRTAPLVSYLFALFLQAGCGGGRGVAARRIGRRWAEYLNVGAAA